MTLTLVQCWVASVALKLLLFPAYKSTDFEVHRNWLAITHSLPIDRWYFDATSQWTLDYPPLFAYWEWFLSQFAKVVDPAMLVVDHLGYESVETVVFQRASVLVSELLLLYALQKYKEHGPKVTAETSRLSRKHKINSAYVVAASILLSPGFLIIDHIHFQYNGAMYGLLVLSIVYIDTYPIYAAFLFSSLLCFKHIYLYLAPAYFVFLLRTVVICQNKKSIDFWRSAKLGCAVLLPIAAAFGPFVYLGQMPQVMARLFPFGRGLCHTYWAPNFWALYSFADRVAIKLAPFLRLPLRASGLSSGTRGLVGDTAFAFLPDVTPKATFVITLFWQSLVLVKLFARPSVPVFIGALTLCGYASFFFGWHVHEKAILLVIVPASLLATRDRRYSYAFRPLGQGGMIALLPLIHTAAEIPLVMAYTVAWLMVFLVAFDTVAPVPLHGRRFVMDRMGQLYTASAVPLLLFTSVIHPLVLRGKEEVDFLPLMMISVWSAWGVMWSWLGFNFLYFTDL